MCYIFEAAAMHRDGGEIDGSLRLCSRGRAEGKKYTYIDFLLYYLYIKYLIKNIFEDVYNMLQQRPGRRKTKYIQFLNIIHMTL